MITNRQQPRGGIVQLTLTTFRSYDQVRLDCDVCPIVLTGANGAGKTNILEAISWLSPGKGLRRASLGEVANCKIPNRPWGVAAVLQKHTAAIDLATGLDPQSLLQGIERRVVQIDQKPVRGQAGLAEQVNILWLTPQMDRLFLEGASERRRFVDRLVYSLDPLHSKRIQSYEHALRERSRLLRDGHFDPDWLSILEQRMAQEGVAVAVARRDFLSELSKSFNTKDSIFPTPCVSMQGGVDEWLEQAAAVDVEHRLAQELKMRRVKDAERGGTSVGPHRSDFEVIMVASGQKAAACSTGEQKALLIAIILSAARLTITQGQSVPILLLDEVVAHLDALRRKALLNELTELQVQCWLTGTDRERFQFLQDKAQFFQVENSTIIPQSML
ncbi:MAG: DNA replication/repair protein RecF [Pseudomonadota bacterium]